MAAEINPQTGEKVFNFASGISSCLFFYASALRCAHRHYAAKKRTPEMAHRTIIHEWLFAYMRSYLPTKFEIISFCNTQTVNKR
jgi:hypothetical protein